MNRDDSIIGVVVVGEERAQFEIGQQTVELGVLLFELFPEFGVLRGKFFESFKVAEGTAETSGLFDPLLFERYFLENALRLGLVGPKVLGQRQLFQFFELCDLLVEVKETPSAA
jgi:hypothetical protein